jgi:hypothetical protein
LEDEPLISEVVLSQRANGQLLVRVQMFTLLYHGATNIVLEVEQVLSVHHHLRPHGVEHLHYLYVLIMNMHTQPMRPHQSKRSNPLLRVTRIRWQKSSQQTFLPF